MWTGTIVKGPRWKTAMAEDCCLASTAIMGLAWGERELLADKAGGEGF